jgi:outer membrane protein W
VGFVLGTAKNGGVGSFTFVPAGLGVKYQFRDDKDLRPYVGSGSASGS